MWPRSLGGPAGQTKGTEFSRLAPSLGLIAFFGGV